MVPTTRFLHRISAVAPARLLPLGVGVLMAVSVAAAQPPTTAPAPSGDPTLNLQLEVQALATLSDLQLSTDQADQLRQLAADTAGQVTAAPSAGEDGDYLSALKSLRRALLSGDDNKVDDAEQKLDDVEDKADAELEPQLKMSEAAKSQAAAALKLLSPRQVAACLDQNSESVPDAADIIQAIDDSHQLSQEDFVAERDQLSQDFSIMAGGLKPQHTPKISTQVKKLLDKARHIPADQFSGQTASLHAEAVDLVKGMDPIPPLRHCMERQLAQLLSNPQLGTALDEWKKVAATPHNSSD